MCADMHVFIGVIGIIGWEPCADLLISMGLSPLVAAVR